MKARADFWFLRSRDMSTLGLLCVRVARLIVTEMANIALDASRTWSFLLKIGWFKIRRIDGNSMLGT